MKTYKLEEKLFISKAIISNVHSMLLKSRFNSNENNEELVSEASNLALEMLRQRSVIFGESVKKENLKPDVPEIDFEEIVKIFNEVCKDCPKVTSITKDRKNLILKILELYSLEQIGFVFTKTFESDYLSGRKSGSDWKATFDWILIPKNFIKILEDNYKNKDNGGKQPVFGRQSADTFIANSTGWTTD